MSGTGTPQETPSPDPSSSRFDPKTMALRGRIGAHALHARHDSRELTRPARETFLRRFLDEVDPDRTLPEAERQRRAEHARKAYMARLALQSARARKRKKTTGTKDAQGKAGLGLLAGGTRPYDGGHRRNAESSRLCPDHPGDEDPFTAVDPRRDETRCFACASPRLVQASLDGGANYACSSCGHSQGEALP
jgi:hypothetical protein